jgi:uncharacterized protein with von Willebrand factor type A (vWA) domain
MYHELGAPVGVTDLIFLTDARAHIPATLRDQFNHWKRSVPTRVIALVLSTGAGDLAALSDEVHLVRTLDPDGEAVGRVLSL